MLDYEDLLKTADVSQDGHIVRVSNQIETHPFYKTDAVECDVVISLTEHQSYLAEKLRDGRMGIIKFSIRSALCQLGLDAFHPEYTGISCTDGKLTATTLLTHLDGERSQPVFDEIRYMAQRKQKPSFSRAVLLPDASIIKRNELLENMEQGRLELSPHAEILPDGELSLPLEHIQHFFNDAIRDPDVLAGIMSGSARAAIKKARTSTRALPHMLGSREFLVTDIHVNTPDFHIILENVIRVAGKISHIIQIMSPALDAGRTVKQLHDQQESGDRQLELWNVNGEPVHTADMRVMARAYRPAIILPAAV